MIPAAAATVARLAATQGPQLLKGATQIGARLPQLSVQASKQLHKLQSFAGSDLAQRLANFNPQNKQTQDDLRGLGNKVRNRLREMEQVLTSMLDSNMKDGSGLCTPLAQALQARHETMSAQMTQKIPASLPQAPQQRLTGQEYEATLKPDIPRQPDYSAGKTDAQSDADARRKNYEAKLKPDIPRQPDYSAGKTDAQSDAEARRKNYEAKLKPDIPRQPDYNAGKTDAQSNAERTAADTPVTEGQSKKAEPKPHYKTLGVDPDATEAEIRTAFRKRALKTHPDQNPNNPEAGNKFDQLYKAYEILSNPTKKVLYDAGKMDEEGKPKKK